MPEKDIKFKNYIGRVPSDLGAIVKASRPQPIEIIRSHSSFCQQREYRTRQDPLVLRKGLGKEYLRTMIPTSASSGELVSLLVEGESKFKKEKMSTISMCQSHSNTAINWYANDLVEHRDEDGKIWRNKH